VHKNIKGDESQLYVSDVDGCLAEKLTGRWLVLAMEWMAAVSGAT